MNNLVSVIIPYYKKKNYIKKCLESVYNQSYKNFEVIIIYDDTDLSDIYFLKKLIKKNYKVRILINKKNLGAGLSRNKGILSARGKFLAFLDADDHWKRTKLSYQIKFMIKNKVDFTFTSYCIIDANSNKIKEIRAKKYLSYKNLINSCDIGLSTVVLRKSILKNLKFPNLNTKEDYVLWLNISKKRKLFGIDKVLTFWTKTKGSLSSAYFQKIKDAFSVYKNHMKYGIVKSIFFTIILSKNFIKKRYL
tara:strand:+ start:1430 stop:2176 length:747 start_codon:yes stop_codon:yes gene_type:complete